MEWVKFSERWPEPDYKTFVYCDCVDEPSTLKIFTCYMNEEYQIYRDMDSECEECLGVEVCRHRVYVKPNDYWSALPDVPCQPERSKREDTGNSDAVL
jgi:hypothetical protein